MNSTIDIVDMIDTIDVRCQSTETLGQWWCELNMYKPPTAIKDKWPTIGRSDCGPLMRKITEELGDRVVMKHWQNIFLKEMLGRVTADWL